MSSMERFEQALYREASLAFDQIVRQYKDDIYVIGFYHFGGWDGVLPMVNTTSYLNSCCGQAEDECERIGFKWNPGEFIDAEDYGKDFISTDEEMQNLHGEWDEPEEVIAARWQQTLDTMCRVLVRLDQAGVFSAIPDRSSFVLSVATYDESYEDGYERIVKMNPQEAINRVEAEFSALIQNEQQIEQDAMDRYREMLIDRNQDRLS